MAGKGDRIFNFNEQAVKAEEKPVCTYTVFESRAMTSSADDPILVLDNAAGEIPHHVNGMFLSPKKRSAFSGEKAGQAYNADIKEIDARFLKLISWLGEEHFPVKLSGVNTERGYCIYKLRAVNLSGGIRSDKDAFLQFAIGRILASKYNGEEEVDEEGDELEDDSLILNSLSGMSDFLACAGNVLPADIRRWANRNLILAKSGNISQEEKRHAQRALSIMLNIQWQGSYFESIDPVAARKILDEELYGMEHVKQRIIETIIQINRTHTVPAYGLLLAGPAGVGKSQVAYAVARIMKLPWASLDMSAIRDTESLTGSPRVYANAKPGLIMEAFSKAGCSNIVFIINELDKADSTKNNSNPSDALLTLLDNIGYTDNYMECMIPTSGVYPIATANDKSKISKPLMSRFAVLDIPDYTPEEKQIIFKNYSLPRILSRMGMKADECVIDDDAVEVIVNIHRDKTGCRDLEQSAEHLAAHALYAIETEGVKSVHFGAEDVRRILG